jgi:hypothetical protein
MDASFTWQETANMEISSTFQNGKLVTKATGIVNASADKVMNSHTSENYASVLGIKNTSGSIAKGTMLHAVSSKK